MAKYVMMPDKKDEEGDSKENHLLNFLNQLKLEQ